MKQNIERQSKTRRHTFFAFAVPIGGTTSAAIQALALLIAVHPEEAEMAGLRTVLAFPAYCRSIRESSIECLVTNREDIYIGH